jgi:uncharacterized glyoxalase superfamily protein PhnB
MKKLTPNLMVTDVNKTVEFYKNILDFETVMTAPQEGTLYWALMKNGAVEIMFQAKESISQEISAFKDKEVGGSFTLYIDVTDIKALYEKVKDHASIVQEMHTTSYGAQEFAINDINGYVLAFAQSK